METLTELFDEGVSWHTPGRGPQRVLTDDDGRVIDGREHFFDLYAWDEFWS